MGMFRRFWSGAEGRKGNAAILFALSIIPLVGATGAAVDYSLANASRTSMQKALDSTALALAKLMPLTQAQLDTQGWQIFTASLGNISVNITPSNLQITMPESGRLVLNVSGQYQPSISGVIGINNFPVGASAEVTWGIGKIEVALVLDNSGSMDGQRITELKKASKNLLNVLKSAAREEGDAKVAIVPFDSRVKVGTQHRNQSWLRWDNWNSENGSCNKSGSSYQTQSACTSQKVCTKSQYTSQSSCQSNGGSWVTATWTTANTNTWDGCVWDRDQSGSPNYDISDAAPTTTNATKYPAWQCAHGLSFPGMVTEMMPLTTNWTSLAGRIDQMQPSGYTNITIGLVWGWHALSPTPVMQEGAAYNTANLSKFLILLSDGDNTRSRHSSTTTTINTRTSSVCTNIKNAGIKIYTIRLIDGNATVLRNCASDPSMYYDVQNASQLSEVFNAIGGQIASLHLSQ